MKFISVSSDAVQIKNGLEKALLESDPNVHFRIQQKIRICPYRIIFIGGDLDGYNDQLENDKEREFIKKIFLSWKVVTNSKDRYSNDVLICNEYLRSNLVRVHKDLTQSSTFLYRIRKAGIENSFLFFTRERDKDLLTPLDLYPIVVIWKLDQGYIPLHASGVFHKNCLFLFYGPSGIGKSTISKFSSSIGDQILDEDQVMVHKIKTGNYSANAWGYSLHESSIPIRAIFRLKKSISDDLIHLHPQSAVKSILEQSFEITGKNIMDNYYKDLFNRVVELSHSVPAYELHFRKSPDFWQLIDAEIPS